MLLIKSKFISFSIVFSVFYTSALYAQSDSINYEAIQRSYSTNYTNLETLYLSFFYPKEENKSEQFLIDSSIKTEDEIVSEKEPLGYDIRLEKLESKTEVNIGNIEINHEVHSR